MNTFVYFRINFFAISAVLLIASLAFYPFHLVYFLLFGSLITLLVIQLCLFAFKPKYLLFTRLDKTTYLTRNWRGKFIAMQNAEFHYFKWLCIYRLSVMNKTAQQSYYFISKPKLAFSFLDDSLNISYSQLDLSLKPKRRRGDLASENYFNAEGETVKNN